MFDLSGKKALVTGATQGIGFEIARLLAAHGAAVTITGASSDEKCQSAAARIPGAQWFRANLTVAEEREALFAMAKDIDILVLNASIQYKATWNEFTEAQYDEMMECNLKASYFLIRAYAEEMKKRGFGRIVTLGSVNQYNQHKELSLYAVTKAAQYKLVKNIAASLAPYGVTINNVAPGAIATPRNAEIYEDDDRRTAVEKAIPCGRFGTPSDIAPAVLLLCSDAGAYITGTEIVIDGGLSLK